MFEEFTRTRVDADGVSINLRYGGSGAPVLLLHGYPQTHVMWHKIAPRWRVTTPWSPPTCAATATATNPRRRRAISAPIAKGPWPGTRQWS